jgi:phage portal protein BeeE
MWPFKARTMPLRPTSEYDVSGAAVVLSTYGDPNMEQVLPTFLSYAQRAYAGNSIVFGAILARIALFSEATFAFQDLSDGHLYGSFETDGRRPGLSKLENPWPGGTSGELFARAEQDASIAGNFYARDLGTRLERLRPDRVTIISQLLADEQGRPYREVVGYGYDREGAGRPTELYDVDEVRPWAPIPDPMADFRGMSWLTPIVREIEADQGMTEYKIQYLQHAATPNMQIVYDKALKPETITSLEDRIAARHGGVGNAFKTMVLDQGADVKMVGNSMEQASFATVQAAGENRILIASGVPGIVVGSKEGLMAATYSNYSQAMRRFTDLTVWPLWRSFCAAMAPLVSVPGGSRLWFDTRHIAALQAGEQERAAVTNTKSASITAFIAAGFTPESAVAAVNSDALQLLEYGGPPAAVEPPAGLSMVKGA